MYSTLIHNYILDFIVGFGVDVNVFVVCSLLFVFALLVVGVYGSVGVDVVSHFGVDVDVDLVIGSSSI